MNQEQNKLYNEIRKNMTAALKAGDSFTKDLLRVLLSDIQRDANKDYSDTKVIAIIKKTVNILYDNHDKYGKTDDLVSAEYLEREYLPKQISDQDIIAYLNTLDFSKFKNKMQSISLVKKHFPQGSVDGKIVSMLVNAYAPSK